MSEPTQEQQAALKAFATGGHLALQAGAGTGKTTTLELLARSTSRKGLYLAFNKSIATEAAGRFPGTVSCRTSHSVAYGAVGWRFRQRMSSPRRPTWQVAKDLGLTGTIRIGTRMLTDKALAHAMLHTVSRYCHSADDTLKARHVPRMRGLEDDASHAELAEYLLPFARKAWADLSRPDGSVVRFEHDHYLKLWALTRPRLKFDFLLLDEAQDTNPVLEQVVLDQRDHAQVVMVGDSAQAIYGWRGAKDVMTGFDGEQLTLSQSFRFGPALADEANRLLHVLESPLQLTGTDTIPTEIGDTPTAAAVLCRTNVGTMVEVLKLMEDKQQVALVGGGDPMRQLALAAKALKEGRPTNHPELILFQSWQDLQDYTDRDPAGADLAPLVNLVEQHGPDAILKAVDRLVSEQDADVAVSTAHKAKGRQWSSVRIAADFEDAEPRPDDDQDEDAQPGPIDPAEARLAYVALTRAQHRLDLGGLSWLRAHPDTAALGDAPVGRARPAASRDESAAVPVRVEQKLQEPSRPAPSADRRDDPLAAWLSTEPGPEHAAGSTSAAAACRAVTKAKKPCPNRAGASGLCHVHDPDRLCGAPTGKNGRGRCHAPTGGGPCRRHASTTTAPSCPRCSQPMAIQPWAVLDQPAGTRIALCTACQSAILTS